MEIKPPKRLLVPWLTDPSYTLIYGTKGIGKTWLDLIISLALTRSEYDEIQIGPWSIKKRAGVLLVDAEMRIGMINERLNKLKGPLSEESPDHPLIILSNDLLGQKHRKQIDLSDKRWREAITALLLKDPRLKVLILDNKASLVPGIDENAKAEWDPVNQWILTVLSLGVSVILVHHANKSGTDRGTSALTDNADTVIKLTDPSPGTFKDGACFKISFDKGRNLYGDELSPFTLRVIPHDSNPLWLTWSTNVQGKLTRDDTYRLNTLKGMEEGKTQRQIAEELGIHESIISRTVKQLREAGMIKGSKPSRKGFDLMREIDEKNGQNPGQV